MKRIKMVFFSSHPLWMQVFGYAGEFILIEKKRLELIFIISQVLHGTFLTQSFNANNARVSVGATPKPLIFSFCITPCVAVRICCHCRIAKLLNKEKTKFIA